MGTNPSFTGDQIDGLATYLADKLAGPDDGSILARVTTSGFRPHKRLLDHVASVIRGEPTFILLDEQQVPYNAIMDSVRAADWRAPKRGSTKSVASIPPQDSSSTTSASFSVRTLCTVLWRADGSASAINPTIELYVAE